MSFMVEGSIKYEDDTEKVIKETIVTVKATKMNILWTNEVIN